MSDYIMATCKHETNHTFEPAGRIEMDMSAPLERDVTDHAIKRAALAHAPKGAQTYYEGKYYKFARGKLWYHDGFEWCLSTRNRSDIVGVR